MNDALRDSRVYFREVRSACRDSMSLPAGKRPCKSTSLRVVFLDDLGKNKRGVRVYSNSKRFVNVL